MPDLEQLGKVAGPLRGGVGGGPGSISVMPLLDTSASLPPSTPSTSRGAARGARAGALSEGIRNSEIKCISLGNAPHSADQIKCIKVQGGESCLEPRGKKKKNNNKTSPKGRKAKTEEGREEGGAEHQLHSQAPFQNYS